ncbi:hypothetical protein Tco_0250716 [Tanacetum coccineum]
MKNLQGQETQSYSGNLAKGKAIGTWVLKNTGNITTNSFDVTTTKVKVMLQNSVHNQGGHKIQNDDIEAFDSDCDEMPTVSAVFMANLYAYDSDVLSEYSKQPVFVDDSNIDITSDSNVICYDQYMKENESEVVQDTTSFEQQDAMIMSVIEEMSNQVAKCNAVNQENKTGNGSLNHFVLHKQLSIEQAFWLPIFKTVSEKPSIQPEPVQHNLPQKLPSTSMVKQNILNAKSHLDDFDKVIKVRTKVRGQNDGTWGFEHIRGAFEKDIIPFVKSLRESFANFELCLNRKVYELKAIFQQMETEVEQCSMDRKYFEIEKKELLIENERFLEQIIFQDIMCTVMHSYDDLVKYADMEKSYIDEYIRSDESIAKHKALEFEIERILRAVVSQDIMSIVQNPTVVETSDLQTELEHQTVAQLGNLKGKCKDTPCVSDTLDPLSQKLKNENVELEFQVLNYAKENVHLKTTYKNLFDSISVTRAQTKTIIDSLQDKLHDTIYENAKLRAQLFDKTSKQKDATKGTSVNTQFCKQSILGKPPSSSGSKLYVVTPFPKSKGLPKIDESHALSKPVTSNSIPIPQESKVVKNEKVIAPGMFRIDPRKTSKEDKFVPINKVRASVRTNSITVSQSHVITKKDVNSNSNGLSSTGIESTAMTRRSQPRSNIKNDRVPSTSKSSCIKIKEVKVEEHYRNLMFSKNNIHMSSECNNIKLAIRNDKSEVVCAMCKQCLITANRDVCVLNYVNDMNSRGHSNLFMVRRLWMLKAHDRKSEASHKFCLEVLGNRQLWR